MKKNAIAARTYESITLIIPTLNEERNIGHILNIVNALYPGIKIIIADDGSKDDTKGIVRRHSKGKGEILFLDRSNKKVHGLTASVIDAISHLETKFFVVLDADFQHPPEKIANISSLLFSGSDVVVGCRSGVKDWPFLRHAMSIGATSLGKIRLLISSSPMCSDIMSGFFGMNTAIAKQLLSNRKNTFVGGGYKLLFEMLKYLPKDTKISEVEYIFGARNNGNSKIGVKHILYFLRSLIS